MGTIIVNILVSALPKILPPKYNRAKNNKKRIEKGIFLQFKIVRIKQNKEITTIIPFKGNRKSLDGFSN